METALLFSCGRATTVDTAMTEALEGITAKAEEQGYANPEYVSIDHTVTRAPVEVETSARGMPKVLGLSTSRQAVPGVVVTVTVVVRDAPTYSGEGQNERSR